ncbi:MetQ/NlpA family ABC transporter substrate-binding protein [Adlercreutzia sp. ZJ138]|uniref:MetQ/NlpA family ABC transporter substrate-binding protein n=1 Tax=Adlercreutzia sp. ZJ138 TaxID=2709405 RepID=UPI0013EC0C96|nr:MetQ/NlpA family ABC transporter substrate-binding protein [Adlercreutzia sp. ZJ138]
MNLNARVTRRKFLALGASAALVTSLGLVGCGSSSDTAGGASENKVITVAASPTPHAEILNDAVAPLLEAQGYTLEVKEFTDYVLPNTATEAGEVDANYFQHQPYLDDFNADQGTHLVSVAAVHYEPFGIYSEKIESLKDLKEGAIVAVPNDTTNEARALLLLEQEGLIKLKEGVGLEATPKDIEENPLNLEIKELEAATIANTLADVDIACLNGNYASQAGLSLADALAAEGADSLGAETYANVLVVKEGNEDSEAVQALKNALVSDQVRDYIGITYDGAVVPVF